MLAVTYWNFRLMVGLGAVVGGRRGVRAVVDPQGPGAGSRVGVYGSLLAVGAPFVANASGWIFTEMGRQPFVVYPNPAVPRAEQMYFFTAQAVSPGITVAEVWTSLIALTVVYGALAVVEALAASAGSCGAESPPGTAHRSTGTPAGGRPRTTTSPAAATTSSPFAY